MPDKKTYDVIIIGSGPAGMFAAYEICKKNLKTLIIDKGKDVSERKCFMIETGKCVNCDPCNIMCGVGGSGTFSDGLLNLRPDIGGNLEDYTKNAKEAWDLVEYVDKIFVSFGAPKEKCDFDLKEVEDLKRKAASAGINFVEIPQRHMGSDGALEVISNFARYLKENGVEFMLETEVYDLIVEGDNNLKCNGVVLKDGRKIQSKVVLLAPGRVGTSWVSKIIKKHRIEAKYGPIDVGVRIEVPAIIMAPITKINRDPKFHIWTQQFGDFVRTFCTNHEGFVVKENYKNFIGVNGQSMKNKKSKNTNFAFLVRIKLTEPVENTTSYGESIANLATTIGGGKPLIQRLGDLRRGRRSTFERLKRSFVENTLKDVTPSNIAMAMPHRILTDILEGLEKLDTVIPGVASDSTLIYAPEIKYYSMQIVVDQDLQTNIQNLFAAGDGAGLSRDIINASATGLIAGRGIIKHLVSNIQS